MPRLGNRLTPKFVETVTKPGLHADGHGLHLLVGPTGGKSWVFRYKFDRKSHDMGLGPLHTVSLKEARRKALTCRQQRLDGLNPLAEKRRARLPAPEIMTFEQCARQYIRDRRAEWKGTASETQWTQSLRDYAFPRIGRLSVTEIDTGAVMRCLDPIWREKTVAASRLRGRIESVLGWATARGYRSGENPARWRGHLENLLPRSSRLKRVTPHAALPADEIPILLGALAGRQGVSARAIEFVILTAARTSEAIGARWDEINFSEKLWTVPASRMKGGLEHRVPLSPPALAVLESLAQIRQGALIFPGRSEGRPLGRNTMAALLQTMEYGSATILGLRAAFATWAAERTNFASEIRESCLAHKVGSAVERSYRRSDFLVKRRQLLEAWARFCTTPPVQSLDNVRAIGAGRG